MTPRRIAERRNIFKMLGEKKQNGRNKDEQMETETNKPAEEARMDFSLIGGYT